MRNEIPMKRYKIASVLMIVHGGFLELGGALCALPLLFLGTDRFDFGTYFAFRLPYFQENLYLMMLIGAMYGALRLIGAVGLLKNKMWGFVLSVINCVITLALMMFLLPAGILDGLLAGTALTLLLIQFFGDRTATQ